ncbi:MAG TPA: flagellar FlbD family protein [Marmoricola sp.]|nr:flagellar FlbD family protein [Marmoricola sp.]
MITLTRLSGSVFVLNSDLIERIDSTPDTVITLIDGKKYVVLESLEDIIEAVRDYRSQVVAFGSQLAEGPPVRPTPTPAADGDPPTRRPNLVPLARPLGEC